MQLHAYGRRRRDTAALVSALDERRRRGVAATRTSTTRTGVALLTSQRVARRVRRRVPDASFSPRRSPSSMPKPELTMLGRTYAIGYEQDLEETLVERPRQRVLDPALPWAIWYPLRRAGSFEQLSRAEQDTDPHGARRHRDGVRPRRARLRHPPRLPRPRSRTTTTSWSACSAASCIRSRSSSSGCGRRSRRRFTSSDSGRSSWGEWRGRAVA